MLILGDEGLTAAVARAGRAALLAARCRFDFST
jgi:hypothetical protein